MNDKLEQYVTEAIEAAYINEGANGGADEGEHAFAPEMQAAIDTILLTHDIVPKEGDKGCPMNPS